MSRLEKRVLQSEFCCILTYCMNANMNLKIAGICKTFFTISTEIKINNFFKKKNSNYIYHGYGLSFVCRRTWIWIFVTTFSHKPHWYFFKLPNCLAIKTCFWPVWLIAVIVKPSAVGVVDIDDGRFLLTFGIVIFLLLLLLICRFILEPVFELSLLTASMDKLSSSSSSSCTSSNEGDGIVDERILFVVVTSNVAGCLRRPPRVFIGS
jgi:hypothetical protein